MAECEQLCRWQIVGGELTLDHSAEVPEDKTIFDMIYPVGAIYTSANNVSPETLFGGTWELTKKEFKDLAKSYILGESDCPFAMTDNIESGMLYVIRSGQGMRFRLDFVSNATFSDTSVNIGTMNWSALGISGTYASISGGMACSDAANAVAFIFIDGATGETTVNEVITKSAGSSIAAGYKYNFPVELILDSAHMLDSCCDKFYWVRTA